MKSHFTLNGHLHEGHYWFTLRHKSKVKVMLTAKQLSGIFPKLNKIATERNYRFTCELKGPL